MKKPNPISAPAATSGGIGLEEFAPRSMLHVPQTRVLRPRFPAIDFHAHLTFNDRFERGVPVGEGVSVLAPPEEILPVMERKGIEVIVNLTGGVGPGLDETLTRFDRAHPGRFVTFAEPAWARA